MQKQLGKLFMNRQFDDVYDATSKEFQQFIDRQKFNGICAEFMEDVTKLSLTYNNPFFQMHNYIWTNEQNTKAVFVTFDREGVIQGLYVKPFETFPEQDKRYTKNMFRMPILDEWYVFWGGANEFQNYHYPYESQRYAFDLVKVKNHQTFDNHQHLYTSYYAYNEQVVAPCSGTVLIVENNIADNEIGETNEQQPAGNYVVIEHAFDEYTFLAHFKQGSIIVKPGDHVYAGQPLGTCGNSGNSSEPHIHFHVMDGPDFETARSIRIRFTDRFDPEQGSTVNGVTYEEQKADIFEKGEVVGAAAEVVGVIARAMNGFFK